MANGSQCCALEICCPPGERRAKLSPVIARSIGCTNEEAGRFLDWMREAKLTFAPESFQPVIDNIAATARRHPVPS